MRRVRICTVVLVLLASLPAAAYQQEIDRISAGIAEALSASGRTRIAVVDFTDLQGDATGLGRFLAEELSISLASGGHHLEIVDRTHLRSILEEHELASTGLVDPATARELGRIAGVQALVTGTLTEFQDSVRVAVKVLDTETAVVTAAIRANIDKTETIQALLSTSVTDQATPVAGDAHKPHSGSSPVQSTVRNQVRFDLRGCAALGGQVRCDLMVTQTGDDSLFSLFGKSFSGSRARAVDDNGNEYFASEVFVGAQRSRWVVQSYQLVSGIPTKAGVTLENVADDVTVFALLEIEAWTGTPGRRGATSSPTNFKIQFREVPVGR